MLFSTNWDAGARPSQYYQNHIMIVYLDIWDVGARPSQCYQNHIMIVYLYIWDAGARPSQYYHNHILISIYQHISPILFRTGPWHQKLEQCGGALRKDNFLLPMKVNSHEEQGNLNMSLEFGSYAREAHMGFLQNPPNEGH